MRAIRMKVKSLKGEVIRNWRNWLQVASGKEVALRVFEEVDLAADFFLGEDF